MKAIPCLKSLWGTQPRQVIIEWVLGRERGRGQGRGRGGSDIQSEVRNCGTEACMDDAWKMPGFCVNMPCTCVPAVADSGLPKSPKDPLTRPSDTVVRPPRLGVMQVIIMPTEYYPIHKSGTHSHTHTHSLTHLDNLLLHSSFLGNRLNHLSSRVTCYFVHFRFVHN